MLNEESKKIITDVIMENTLFNIVCQGIYDEVDLTVKPRIYFFLNESGIKTGNLLEQSKDKTLNKEEEKTQNDITIKEESKNINKSNVSKNV